MDYLVKVENISKNFKIKSNKLFKPKKILKAVNDVSFFIKPNESLGLVGESGCGKSTLARLILALLTATSGRILFNDEDITKFRFNKLKELRKNMQIVFQDPYSSLNPRKTILDIVAAPLKTHFRLSKSDIEKKVKELLDLVGISDKYLQRYPHEFSGGQRQRIGIARALAISPKLIVCDEPVSALDVSIQAQTINLLEEIKERLKLSYLFISHDLSVVRHISDRVLVMYLGKIVEIADKTDLFNNPLHPYTKALISAIPVPEVSEKKERIILTGDIELPIGEKKGCVFASRCYMSQKICFEQTPIMKNFENGRSVMCHFV
ncbi:MAG: ATP-binding cassette domain-containing protein [Spirochaetes bacterium]|nr:ATP-binding cassette domain-containing protein [Spirochaetota bacterium]